jgi:hypothetical protein
MLHGSISNSEKLAALSCDGARLLFTWMIPHCDNLGRIRADPIYLKAVVVPRTDATLRQIEAWAEEIAGAGLATLYKCQGQHFMEIAGWSNFQRIIGNMKRESDLPAPTERSMNSVCTPSIPRSNEVSPEGGGEGEGEGKEPIPSPPALRASRTAPSSGEKQFASLEELPLAGGATFRATTGDLAGWSRLFPAVDVPAQFRSMRAWLDAKPERRKTPRGIKAFVARWLSREQDRGGTAERGANPANGPASPVEGEIRKSPQGQVVWWHGNWRSPAEASTYGWRPK